MKRRQFITSAASAAMGLVMGCQPRAADSPKPGKRPNVLFIITDQQHAGMMSCMGNKWLKTPAVDSLAACGIRFERAYACNPVCAPNRFSIQTGLMPSAVGMGRNEHAAGVVETDEMMAQTLGRLFQNAGYETAYGGKVHLPPKMNNVENIGYRYLTNDKRQGLAETCAKFIKGHHSRPFFLFASFINPHDICYMAINDFNRSKGKGPIDNLDSRICEQVLDRARNSGDIDAFVKKNCPPLPVNHHVPGNEPQCITEKYLNARAFRAYARKNWTENQWRLHRWLYCRLTEIVDSQIKTVLDALRQAGLEDNTLIVFTSDHGDMDSAHKMEHKSVLYEEALRIPLIIRYKGRIAKGLVDDTHLVSNGLDVLPTLCDYAGIEPPVGLHGASLRPLAEGKLAKNWRDFVVFESQNGRGVRTQRYKYCIYDSGEHREQLIDLKSDPGEMNNLAELEDYKQVLEKHRQLLHRWIETTGDKIASEYIDIKT